MQDGETINSAADVGTEVEADHIDAEAAVTFDNRAVPTVDESVGTYFVTTPLVASAACFGVVILIVAVAVVAAFGKKRK